MSRRRIEVRIGRVVVHDAVTAGGRTPDTDTFRAALIDAITARWGGPLGGSGSGATVPGSETDAVASAVAASTADTVLAALPPHVRKVTTGRGTAR